VTSDFCNIAISSTGSNSESEIGLSIRTIPIARAVGGAALLITILCVRWSHKKRTDADNGGATELDINVNMNTSYNYIIRNYFSSRRALITWGSYRRGLVMRLFIILNRKLLTKHAWSLYFLLWTIYVPSHTRITISRKLVCQLRPNWHTIL